MAKFYHCDRCKGQVEATEEGRREWTHVVLGKIEGSAFQNADLCNTCTTGLRNFLAQGLTGSNIESNCTCPPGLDAQVSVNCPIHGGF